MTKSGFGQEIDPSPRSGSQNRNSTKRVRIYEEVCLKALEEYSREVEGRENDKGFTDFLSKCITDNLDGISPKISPDYMETLRELSIQWGIKMGDLNEHMISVFAEAGVKPNDLREYVRKEAEKAKAATAHALNENDFGWLDDACLGLAHAINTKGEMVFRCIWNQDNSPPKIKNIGKTNDMAKNACAACGRTGNLEKRWQKILELDKNGVITDHIYCSKGSQLDDKKNRIRCEITRTWIDQDQCFTIDLGNQCFYLKTVRSRPIKKTGIRRRKARARRRS